MYIRTSEEGLSIRAPGQAHALHGTSAGLHRVHPQLINQRLALKILADRQTDRQTDIPLSATMYISKIVVLGSMYYIIAKRIYEARRN